MLLVYFQPEERTVIGLLLACSLGAPQVEDKGWELKIERANPAEPVFAGEYADGITVTVTLKNTTDKERGYVPVPRAIARHVLDANIVDPKGEGMGQLCRRSPADDFKNLTPVAAGKTVSFPVTLNRFGYMNLYAGGKYTVRLSYQTPDGRVVSNALPFEVIDPPNDALLARRQVPPGGRIAQRPLEERETAFVDQVKVGDKVYLLYRVYVGPKYGTACSFAKRIATLPGKVDMVVVGAHGSRLPDGWERFFLAYPHKPNGMTTLRIQSVGCEIEERLVFEPSTNDDPKQGWGLFEKCKFTDRDNYPPEKLRLTYAAFVASVAGGGQAKFCLHSVDVADAVDPKRGEFGTGINIPWMKEHFSASVMSCRNDPDDTFLIRTGTTYMYWVQTRSGEWKLFKYGDKPIK